MKSVTNNRPPILANEYECTGCFACVAVCPTGALSPVKHQDGHMYVQLDKDLCIKCHKCELLCRSIREGYGSNNFDKSEVYAGWSNREEQRKNATSGGIFAAVAHNVIKNGGAVAGVCSVEKNYEYNLIYDYENIAKMQGTKYSYSSPLNIYDKIAKEIQTRTVLFVGLGCQCAAIIKYFENSPYKRNLLVMDLVCGGVPSSILLEKYFEHEEAQKILSFRTKDKYELTIMKDDEKRIVERKSLPLHGYCCGMTNRNSCYDCKFAFAHRKSDLTIGDLWNYQIEPKEHQKGISMVVVHSDKGRGILKEINATVCQIKWEDVAISNFRIVSGKKHIYAARKHLDFLSKKLNYEQFRRLYCLDPQYWEILLIVYKVYVKAFDRIQKTISVRKIKKLLEK